MNPAPRLLSINNYHYPRGGADIVYLEQNRIFEEAGWDVAPFSMRHPKNFETPWQRFFVEEIEFGHDYGLLDKARRAAKVIYSREARRNANRLIAEARPDVAHAHNIYHHISPAILPLLRKAGIPTVMTLHDLKLACPAYSMRVDGAVCERCRGGRIHNVMRRRCIKGSLALSSLIFVETAVHRTLGLYRDNVDRFVVPSRFYLDKLVEWGWQRDQFVHVPNFVDTDRLRPDGETGRGFVYVGRLSPEKGIDTLIRAAALSGERAIIVGRGPQEAELRALAERLGADIVFAGFRSGTELHDAVRAARALVLPSVWYENAPISVLEAYALGRPVIGARIGGIPELIREGDTGTTFAPGDVEGLAAAMRALSTMPESAFADMAAAGRAWVEHDFSLAAYRDRLVSLYRALGARVA